MQTKINCTPPPPPPKTKQNKKTEKKTKGEVQRNSGTGFQMFSFGDIIHGTFNSPSKDLQQNNMKFCLPGKLIIVSMLKLCFLFAVFFWKDVYLDSFCLTCIKIPESQKESRS